MNEVQCLFIGILLFKRVIARVLERGHLTAKEKSQIFKTIYLLTTQMAMLSHGFLNEPSQLGELAGQLEMPWIQHKYLEQKGT